MKIVTEEGQKWKRWINALSKTMDDVTIGFNKEGVFHKSRSPSGTSMISFDFDKSSFKEYNLNQSRSLAVNIGKLSDVLKTINKEDDLEISLTKDDDELEITMVNGNERKFSLPILVTSEEAESAPKNLSFTTNVVMGAGELLDEIKNVELISDRFMINSDKNGIEISACGGQGNYSSSYTDEDLEQFDITAESESIFKCRVVENFLSSLKKSNNVLVKIGQDNPLKIIAGDDKSSIEFILAPIIENQ